MTSASPEKPSIADHDQSSVSESRENCAKPGCVSSSIRFLWQCLVVSSGFLLVVGLFLRLTLRDSIPYLSVFYYATPIIVLALTSLILCSHQVLLRRKRTALAWFLLTIVFFGWWHFSTHFSLKADTASINSASGRKILFWNIKYVDAGWPALIRELQMHDADVIGLVEVGPGYPDILNQLRSEFPEHRVLWVRHGIMLIRGNAEILERGVLNHHGAYAVARSRFPDGRILDLVLLDIHGFILMPRGPAFQALNQILESYDQSPLCVMGDFNTPPDSVFFRTIRTRLENAYEVSGDGYHVTWPVLAPVLALDQIWLPPETAVSCELRSTPLSDHRMVIADYRPGTDPGR